MKVRVREPASHVVHLVATPIFQIADVERERLDALSWWFVCPAQWRGTTALRHRDTGDELVGDERPHYIWIIESEAVQHHVEIADAGQPVGRDEEKRIIQFATFEKLFWRSLTPTENPNDRAMPQHQHERIVRNAIRSNDVVVHDHMVPRRPDFLDGDTARSLAPGRESREIVPPMFPGRTSVP